MFSYVFYLVCSDLSEQASCLTDSVSQSPFDFLTGNILPGQVFTADDQCRMIFGNGSSFCRVNTFEFK